MSDVAYLKSALGVHPNFPKEVRSISHLPAQRAAGSATTNPSACLVANTQGITFLDIFPLLRDPLAFETLITHLLHHITTTHAGVKPDVIVGLDARGFLFGPILAQRLGAAFVPVRKAGKLPGACNTVEYAKEYGVDKFEMQKDAIKPGQTVIVVE